MALELINTPLEGLVLIRPRVFKDTRGYFFESYNAAEWHDAGLKVHFVQDNQSLSGKGTLRGLHFQRPPFAQGKLIRVVKGKIMDVAVDLRKDSPTYGSWYKAELSGDNFLQMFIPEGFAHGFLTLEDDTVVSYKCTQYYRPDHEGGLPWNDVNLNIEWGESRPVLSEKDGSYQPFSVFESPF